MTTGNMSPEEMKKWNENQPNLSAVQLSFIPIDGYTTFRAEFAMEAGDIIFHFFKTPEIEALGDNTRKYWAEVFPKVLEQVCVKSFAVAADSGRLKAQHVWDQEMDLDSWWFRAYGFGHLLDPHRVSLRFLEALDEGLDAALPSIRT